LGFEQAPKASNAMTVQMEAAFWKFGIDGRLPRLEAERAAGAGQIAST